MPIFKGLEVCKSFHARHRIDADRPDNAFIFKVLQRFDATLFINIHFRKGIVDNCPDGIVSIINSGHILSIAEYARQ